MECVQTLFTEWIYSQSELWVWFTRLLKGRRSIFQIFLNNSQVLIWALTGFGCPSHFSSSYHKTWDSFLARFNCRWWRAIVILCKNAFQSLAKVNIQALIVWVRQIKKIYFKVTMILVNTLILLYLSTEKGILYYWNQSFKDTSLIWGTSTKHHNNFW